MFLASMREREKENEDIVELKSNADVLVRITFLYGPSFNFLQFPRVVRSLSLSSYLFLTPSLLPFVAGKLALPILPPLLPPVLQPLI